MKIFEVAIIGGGPAGLSAALALSRVRRHSILFDTQHYRNQPASSVHTVLGHDGRPMDEFREICQQDVTKYNMTEFSSEKIDTVVRTEKGFKLNDRYCAEKIIFTSGVYDVYPDIKGYGDIWGKSIYHCIFCHGYEQRDDDLAVLGTDMFALHAGLGSTKLNKSITFLTNGQLSSEIPDEVKEKIKKAGLHLETRRLRSLSDKGSKLQVNFETGDARVFKAMLHTPPTFVNMQGIFENLGVKFTEAKNRIEIKDQMGHTNIPGIYAAGDLITMATSVTQAIVSGSFAGVGAHFDLV